MLGVRRAVGYRFERRDQRVVQLRVNLARAESHGELRDRGCAGEALEGCGQLTAGAGDVEARQRVQLATRFHVDLSGA